MKNTNIGQGLIFGEFQVFQILTSPDFTRVLTSFKFPQVPLTSNKFYSTEITQNAVGR